jgi:hypothetical protein
MDSLRYRYVRAVVHRGAEFLREAAVLVFVFSLLDKLIIGRISLAWVALTVLAAFCLLSMAIVTEVEGQRYLGRARGS